MIQYVSFREKTINNNPKVCQLQKKMQGNLGSSEKITQTVSTSKNFSKKISGPPAHGLSSASPHHPFVHRVFHQRLNAWSEGNYPNCFSHQRVPSPQVDPWQMRGAFEKQLFYIERIHPIPKSAGSMEKWLL